MQRMKSLISIIVPIYNVERYLDKCLESIIRQRYKWIEVILVNDGSTDDSGKICDKYKREDGRIRIIHKKNGGLVSARKAGLKEATGKYIGFVDGDDYIDENMFLELVNNIEETGADFVHSGYITDRQQRVYSENSVVDLKCKEDREEFLKEYVLDYMSEKYISPSIWSKLYNAKLIKESYSLVPDTQPIGEDLVSLVECILRCKRVSLLNLTAYHYATRNGSLSNLGNIHDLLWQANLYEVLKNTLERHASYDQEKKWLDNLFVHFFCCSLEKKLENKFAISNYFFVKIEMLFGKKVVLYGAGEVGRDYYSQICRYSKCKIVAWIDNNYQNIYYDCAAIKGIEYLNECEYDYIVLAVKKEKMAKEIKKLLTDREYISPSKIIWEKPQSICGQ